MNSAMYRAFFLARERKIIYTSRARWTTSRARALRRPIMQMRRFAPVRSRGEASKRGRASGIPLGQAPRFHGTSARPPNQSPTIDGPRSVLAARAPSLSSSFLPFGSARRRMRRARACCAARTRSAVPRALRVKFLSRTSRTLMKFLYRAVPYDRLNQRGCRREREKN